MHLLRFYFLFYRSFDKVDNFFLFKNLIRQCNKNYRKNVNELNMFYSIYNYKIPLHINNMKCKLSMFNYNTLQLITMISLNIINNGFSSLL